LSATSKIEDEIKDCVKGQRVDFNNHDQVVDVVSCWHGWFDAIFKNSGNGLFFDRYPDLNLTPDFTMLFSEKYGIVVDVARSISNDEKTLRAKAIQLKSYDSSLHFRTNQYDTNGIVPEKHDIVLILHSKYANKGAFDLLGLIEKERDLKLENNLIILNYDFSMANAQSAYMFNRLLYEKNGHFRDSSLPNDLSLEEAFFAKMQPLICTPEKFVINKATFMFCNDEPCSIYLATRLWDRILPTILTDEQLEVWKNKSSKKIVPIISSSNELCELIRDMSPGCRIRTTCMDKALEYIRIAGRATFLNGKWTIFFGNIKARRSQGIGESGSEVIMHDMQDYADVLSEMYCKGKSGQPLKIDEDGEESTEQKSLFDF
jgi:hypothetical protein